MAGYMALEEQIGQASRIEAIAGQYTELIKDGARRLKGLCPLHVEKHKTATA